MSTLDTTITCDCCGEEVRALFLHPQGIYLRVAHCVDALCENADGDDIDVQLARLRADIKGCDVSDEYHIGGLTFRLGGV